MIRTPDGGYGDPLKRSPDLVLRDMLNGLVTLETAEGDYSVIIDHVSRQV